MPSGFSIGFVGVVLRCGVEPDVQPVDTKAGSAEPDRLRAEPTLESRADQRPQLMLLLVGRSSCEHGNLCIGGKWSAGARDDKRCIAAKI